MELLSGVASPPDLKLLDIDELHTLCRELRDFLIGSVAATGGHLALGPAQGTTVLALARTSDEQHGVDRATRHASFSHKLMRLAFNGATVPHPQAMQPAAQLLLVGAGSRPAPDIRDRPLRGTQVSVWLYRRTLSPSPTLRLIAAVGGAVKTDI